MAKPLPQRAKDLIDAHAFVVLATQNDDDGPNTTLMWATRDDDTVLMATSRGRRKERNLTADPRASVLILDPANAYRYVELRGEVEIDEDGAAALDQRLSHEYTGEDFVAPDDAPRVVLKLTTEHTVEYGY